MKNKIFAFSILAMALSAKSFAQSSATAEASATIIQPISISKVTDMNFGNIAAGTGGTVVLATDGTRTQTGGITLPVSAGTVAAAGFTVSGDVDRTFSITLPSSITLTNGTDNLTVNDFTSTPSTTGTLTEGTATVSVGATLTVPASAPAGVYTNTTDLTVTVNYN